MKNLIAFMMVILTLLSFSACQQSEVEISSSEPAKAVESGEHIHNFPSGEQTVSETVVGYCGNTQTTIHFQDGTSYSFMGSNSVTLTDIFANLDYISGYSCDCSPEYKVDTEFGTDYGVSLTGKYARYEGDKAELTEEQVETIKKIIDWAKDEMK